MAFRARIDHDFVYWGPEEVAELGPGDIAAPDDAIKPGRYRWQPAKDGDVGHWVPLAPSQVKKVESAPSIEQALAELLTDTPPVDRGPKAAAWLDHYLKSVDAIGGQS